MWCNLSWGTSRVQNNMPFNPVFRNALKRGKGLYVKSPAMAACSISVSKKESVASGKRSAEEWLDDDGAGKESER